MSDDLLKKLESPANVFYEYAADEGAMLREAAATIRTLQEQVKTSMEALPVLQKLTTNLSSVSDDQGLVLVYAMYAPQGGVGKATAGEIRSAIRSLKANGES